MTSSMEALESRLTREIEGVKLQQSRPQDCLSEVFQSRLRSEVESMLQGLAEDLQRLQGQRGRDMELLRIEDSKHEKGLETFRKQYESEMEAMRRFQGGLGETVNGQFRSDLAAVEGRVSSNMEALKSQHGSLSDGLRSRLGRLEESLLQMRGQTGSDLEALSAQHKADRYEAETQMKQEFFRALETLGQEQRQCMHVIEMLQNEKSQQGGFVEGLRSRVGTLEDSLSQLQGQTRGDLEALSAQQRAHRHEAEAETHQEFLRAIEDLRYEQRQQGYAVEALQIENSKHNQEVEALRKQCEIAMGGLSEATHNRLKGDLAAIEGRIMSDIEDLRTRNGGAVQTIEALRSQQVGLIEALEASFRSEVECLLNGQIGIDIETLLSQQRADRCDIEALQQRDLTGPLEEVRSLQQQHGQDIEVLRIEAIRRVTVHSLSDSVHHQLQEEIGLARGQIMGDVEVMRAHLVKGIEELHGQHSKLAADISSIGDQQLGRLIEELRDEHECLIEALQGQQGQEIQALRNESQNQSKDVEVLRRQVAALAQQNGQLQGEDVDELRSEVVAFAQQLGQQCREVEALKHEDMRRVGELEALRTRHSAEIEILRSQQSSFVDMIHTQVKTVVEAMRSQFRGDIDGLRDQRGRSETEMETLRGMLVSAIDELRSEHEAMQSHHDGDIQATGNLLLQRVETLRSQLGAEIDALRNQHLRTEELLAQDVGSIKAQIADDIQRLGSAAEVVQAMHGQIGYESEVLRSQRGTQILRRQQPRGGENEEPWNEDRSESGLSSHSYAKAPKLWTPSRTKQGGAAGVSFLSPSISAPGDTSELEGSFIEDMLGQLRSDVDSVQSNIDRLRSQCRPGVHSPAGSPPPAGGPRSSPSRGASFPGGGPAQAW